MNKWLSTCYFFRRILFELCTHASSINICMPDKSKDSIGLQPLYKRQALTHSPQSRSKPFKREVRHTQSTRHQQLHNTTKKMSSIDAIVNAGPSGQQIDDEPVEKFDALNIREDSEGWNDVEDDNEEFNVQCLFCSESSTSLVQALEHMKAQHEFDLVAFRTRHGG